jgi:large subunit ribosomal protein L21
MFAIVDIQGQQFKVSKNQHVYVHRLPAEEGTTITLGDGVATLPRQLRP